MLKINNLSKIGIGTYRMSSDINDHIDVLNYALEVGINTIDTAPNYTFGKSEFLIGNTISKNNRNKVFIISKVGYIQGEDINKVKNIGKLYSIQFNENFFFSLAPEFVSFQLEQSLKRLKTDYIDCYLLHNPEHFLNKGFTKSDLKNIIFEAFSLLEEKVKKGIIRYYGISSNNFDSIPLSDIFVNQKMFPNFKFLQFPYNIIEGKSIFVLDSNNNISLYELKAKGLILLSNRPLNTTYENKVLRLSDSYIQDIDIVEKNENLLFGSFGAKIKQRLSDIKEDTMLEKYYPIHFFIENRKMIANQEAIDKSINILLIPFLEAIGLKNEKMFQILRDLRNYWIIFSKYDNQNRLDNLKDKLYNEKKIIKNDNRDFSLTLAEKYIEKGIDTVLMGLTKKNYIDKIKSIL